MTLKELTNLEPGAHLSVANTPFPYTGKAEITLDSGDHLHWLYSGKEGVLAISQADEELIAFDVVDEELEPDNGTILYQGDEYEFTYEDTGVVKRVEGELGSEEEDRVAFSDYEDADGDRIRLVTNENTGESTALWGQIVVEDEINLG